MVQVTTDRLQVSEERQQRMVDFIAKAMLNPAYFAQFVSQQDPNNHVVRKKRRLPIHEDEGDFDESVSSESSIENQIVTFQHSGLGEAKARAMVTQMLFPSDSPADSNDFEGSFRDLDVSHNGGGTNSLNRQSRVNIEEITTKFPDILSNVPIITDVSTSEDQEATPPSDPLEVTRMSSES